MAVILFSELNNFCDFGKGSLEEHFYEIILKLGHLPRRSCCFKVFIFLALAAILFSG